MVFKTLIAATCAAALAGSVVYFGTNPGNEGGSVKLDKVVSAEVQSEKPRVIDRYISPKKKTKDTQTHGDAESTDGKTTDKPAGETETKTKPKPKVQPYKASKTEVDPAQKRIDVVFRQAERIAQPELRDRAYLDLTDYATSKGLFDQAQKAALRIKQVELRDTARSRIAMGMARYGMANEAFALIEKVEVKELKDVMRLQVIEALLGTDTRR